MAVYVCGDTHRTHDIKKLYDFKHGKGAQLTKNDYVIVCGDFGLLFSNPTLLTWRAEFGQSIPSCSKDNSWDERELQLLEWYEKAPWTTLWVDGNHENFDRIELYPISEWHSGRVQKISDSVIHLMRGEIYDIDGHSFFCMGGAQSTDRGTATGTEWKDEGIIWWRREIPTDVEWEYAHRNLASRGYKVDFIITHDVPCGVDIGAFGYRSSKVSEELETIRTVTDFKWWFCGHMHIDRDYFWKHLSVLYNREPMDVEEYINWESENEFV